MRIGFVGDVHLLETPPQCRKDDYLDSLLVKMGHICSECDLIIFLGDLFHRPTMSLQSFGKVINFFVYQIDRGKQFYSIIGNHDIPNFNKERLGLTSLGLLDSVRLVKVMDLSGLTLGPVTIDVIPFAHNIKITTKPRGGFSILLGHCFYDEELDPDYSLTPEEVEGSGYSYILLGHDHRPYPPVQRNGTTLLRFGSLCRNTSHGYQLERRPQYLFMEVSETEILTYPELRDAGGLPPEEVFHAEVYSSPSESELIHAANLDGLMKRFENKSARTDTAEITVKSALLELKTPSSIIHTIEAHYEKNGMAFR